MNIKLIMYTLFAFLGLLFAGAESPSFFYQCLGSISGTILFGISILNIVTLLDN